ncbi:MAG: hypothetical protein JSU82_04900 [Rhodospirillales bacterium]|nr:MAG: hypothetical protein JSU82_04900 [Rhodospirillales bacterium]
MITLPFRLSHLGEIALGREELLQQACFGSSMFGALDRWPGPAWSLADGSGRILGCLGALLIRDGAVLWAVLSDAARANRYGLHRAARCQLDLVERTVPAKCMLTAVRTGFEPGHRWVSRLGFARHGGFEIDNQLYERYVKLVHRQR